MTYHTFKYSSGLKSCNNMFLFLIFKPSHDFGIGNVSAYFVKSISVYSPVDDLMIERVMYNTHKKMRKADEA